jgi:hypothetical protein
VVVVVAVGKKRRGWGRPLERACFFWACGGGGTAAELLWCGPCGRLLLWRGAGTHHVAPTTRVMMMRMMMMIMVAFRLVEC